MLNFHIISIFPETIRPYLDESILRRAVKKGIIKIKYYDPRDFTKDKHRSVDDRPYGGGPGMVMMAEPILRAARAAIKGVGKNKKVKVIILSPNGKQFTNQYAKTLSKKYTDIVLTAGHYEGIDSRVKKILKAEELSIGPYVLSGGELPAAVVVDSVARQLKGVLGNEKSVEESRVATAEMYTRPEVIKNMGKTFKVPPVLLSGDHEKIRQWRERGAGK